MNVVVMANLLIRRAALDGVPTGSEVLAMTWAIPVPGMVSCVGGTFSESSPIHRGTFHVCATFFAAAATVWRTAADDGTCVTAFLLETPASREHGFHAPPE